MKNKLILFYYKIFGVIFLTVAIYGFIVPFLVSYPDDILSLIGFIIGISYVPVIVVLIYKSILSLKK